ncbi:MAG: hypothetical protein NZM06_10800 [Chloroherpetonaceae bacterium]|nr:hypothetical protein [Chloroherpetonaceae bacterium]MDW8438193.1 hypothetical protein [Chloroherpetonaceae bacterium]
MQRAPSVNRLSPEIAKEIALQTLAAQLGFELCFAGEKVYCSSEFHYKVFSSREEAERFLISERLKRQPFQFK